MLHIFIPVYNEDEVIEKLISSIFNLFNKKIDFNLLIIDDGSVDKTPIILNKFIDYPNVTILTHPFNRGLGETERDGFEFLALHSEPDDIIIRLEGDNSHDPKYIIDIVRKLNDGFDVVNTSRFRKGGGQRGLNYYRSFISYGANLFMKVMLRVKNVSDFSCGYRGFRAEVLKDAIAIYGKNFLQLRGLGFTSTLEIIVKMKMLGCSFAEVPFLLRYDKKQSSSKMVGSITTFGYLVMAILYHWPFGGWRTNYNRLRKNYKSDRDKVLKEYIQKDYKIFRKLT